MRAFAVTVLIGLVVSNVSFASEDPWTFNIYFENDLFADTDLSYTNGVRFSWVSQDVQSFSTQEGQAYNWVNTLNDWFEPLHPGDSKQEAYRNIVVSAGQMMFTPEDRFRTTVDTNDRPYAGWLYGGIGYQMRRGHKLNTVELSIGVVGPAALAHQTQDFVHEAQSIEVFHGWDNQLENELGLQIIFERKSRFKLWQQQSAGNWSADFIPHWGASLGNVATYANAGGELRFGYRLADDFGVSTIRPGGENITPGQGEPYNRPWQVYGFVSADARYVARNIFLDGNTFETSHSVDKRHWVGDVAVGVTAAYRRWRISYSQVYRSKEFKTQRKSQSYGSISLSYSY